MPEHFRVRTLHIQDPKEVIFERLGPDLEQVEIWGSSILVATYIRPATRTASGLEISQETTDEDRFQGKIGLVVKTGPRAFENNERDYPMRIFNGRRADPGTWVVFRASDGLRLMIGSQECRCIPDGNIKATVTHPDAVF